jgi:hypothetical protein
MAHHPHPPPPPPAFPAPSLHLHTTPSTPSIPSILQADYHQDKFKPFPHVNSPAWLIREITRRHEQAAMEQAGEGEADA